jgi:hypothetical protein
MCIGKKLINNLIKQTKPKMSINLVRSPRKTDFWRLSTPGNIGPGVYSNNMSFTENNREK